MKKKFRKKIQQRQRFNKDPLILLPGGNSVRASVIKGIKNNGQTVMVYGLGSVMEFNTGNVDVALTFVRNLTIKANNGQNHQVFLGYSSEMFGKHFEALVRRDESH